MNPLKTLSDFGQAAWLDFLSRSFIEKGELRRLIENDDLRGVTSNPAIFEKAIADTDEYDPAVTTFLAGSDASVSALYEHLVFQDIRRAADALRPVHESTGGVDGYVSLEVSPYLADDTEGTLAEARRFWAEVDRPNLMIKVPATPAGLPAIRTLVSEGINVNVTLLFSQTVHEEVARAYIEGLRGRLARGGDVSGVASVASFFISRIDVAVDRLLEQAAAKASGAEAERLLALRGKTAVANAKLAYQRYRRLFGEGFADLRAAGARPQRLLWASTGAKNKAYSDVLYVDELIGPDTVNTLPPATMDAFRDHGRAAFTLESDLDEAAATLEAVAAAGIDLEAVARELLRDGVRLFADAADKLLGSVARKRLAALGERVNSQHMSLPEDLAVQVGALTEQWRAGGAVRRLWAGDPALWTGGGEDRWVGWLRAIFTERERAEELIRFHMEVASLGFRDALLIGMGGSSLGPEVLAATFGAGARALRLHVIDSTDPAQIAAVESQIDLKRTLFIVASKSGSTLEPNLLRDYFYEKVAAALGRDGVGSRFVAITDPGSPMEEAARRAGFWRIFHGQPDIGGRYSVVSRFGLVPAAVIGMDVRQFIRNVRTMAWTCGADAPPADNPGVQLGLALGAAANAGRNKVTLIASPAIRSFGAWAEQLIAESTGKQGKALIPVDLEPAADVSAYGRDRVFIYLRLRKASNLAQDAFVEALEKAGHPVVRIDISQPERIVQEFFRFMIATATAGAVTGVNPFDQPDVEASKARARELAAAIEETGALPESAPVAEAGPFALYADAEGAAAIAAATRESGLAGALAAHFGRLRPGDYAAILAYIQRNDRHVELLQALRLALLRRHGAATCLGFGPRFLHSTGQAYKGGPNTGVFLQITAETARDLQVPGHRLSFGQVIAAQAAGDLAVLDERKRRYLRVHVRGDLEKALAQLAQAAG
ncbi:bifunctional transaldolase/phosoglucose isomerase [Camelimonas abortus]|uniref:Transaldolase n=1 Tax=Camelimonas abortus TaxID=1017184 RepID=A0ABV7LGV6_9HYPH